MDQCPSGLTSDHFAVPALKLGWRVFPVAPGLCPYLLGDLYGSPITRSRNPFISLVVHSWLRCEM